MFWTLGSWGGALTSICALTPLMPNEDVPVVRKHITSPLLRLATSGRHQHLSVCLCDRNTALRVSETCQGVRKCLCAAQGGASTHKLSKLTRAVELAESIYAKAFSIMRTASYLPAALRRGRPAAEVTWAHDWRALPSQLQLHLRTGLYFSDT